MSKLTFSGHETFECRTLWLKKGIDFVKAGCSFQSPDAGVHLGVGRNMVESIRFWLSAFGLVKQDKLTSLGRLIFGPRGKDPFLEDIGTMWLLHYSIIVNRVASLYSLLFNEFRRERMDFTREQLRNFVRTRCDQNRSQFSPKTVDRDIGVLLKNYVGPEKASSNLEEDYAGVFLELNLIRESQRFEGEATKKYKIENGDRSEIPPEILLYCILDNKLYGNSIPFRDLLVGPDSIGSVFALTADGLLMHIERLSSKYPFMTYRDDAGIREVQFKTKQDKFDILTSYYDN